LLYNKNVVLEPITETQKDIKESLVSELRPIKESLKELPATSSHCGTSRRQSRRSSTEVESRLEMEKLTEENMER